MTVMHLSVTFQQQCDTSRSVRETARREALARLQNAISAFDTMTAEHAAALAASNAPVTSGVYDPEDTEHDPIEDR
ncbi:hypothetical protein HUN39_18525 [Methylocystis sp. FS]|jgi:hypothetical protein|uniref:hypothetical protein n=1 Tax=Methylocystis silviterrae TaxID=2743612 RepID=UPI001582BA04|nr:hypothetical protein [Methylocystis silviterrae]NUJ81984.1 hypothetical protein [Methylocystis silviterrae]